MRFLPGMLLALAQIPAPAQEAARTDFEERLLGAELLEVSSGELDKAMAVYRALADDEQASGAVRASALLYLGRCHRKKGELAQAKNVLESIAATHPDATETIARANGFLEELRQGRASHSEFDWLTELQAAPEIQARVFTLAMEIQRDITESSRKRSPSYAQLLAGHACRAGRREAVRGDA